MRANGIVHSFTESLEASLRLNQESDWVAFYKRMWPDATMIIRVDADSQMQRSGIDRVIWLPSGKQLLIDEKCRERDYGDVLLETISVKHLSKIGWALDDAKLCDFVAYAIPSVRKCYMLPFQLMKEALRHNKSLWESRYGTREAKNNGYVTVNVPVPWCELAAEIKRQMLRSFGSEVALPPATKSGEQLEFQW